MFISDLNIIEWLKSSDNSEKNRVDFGIIGFNNEKKIKIYNEIEEKLSGYSKDFVIDKNIFEEIAPCMNNYMVALKFDENEELDEILPYILSFKVKPTPINLRLIKNKKLTLSYILIDRNK